MLAKEVATGIFSVNGSRGSVIDKAEDLQKISEGFGVFGNYKEAESQEFGSNWFNNVKVTYSSQDIKWTYSPVKYWLPQGHIDFLAYAPRVEETTLKNKSCIDFTVEGEVAKQKDLLWANATNQTKDNISSTNNKVKFQFAHALSRLGYTVKLSGDYPSKDVTFTLKKITLAGSPTDATKGAFYTSGTIDLSKKNKKGDLWSNQTGKQNFDWFSGDYIVNKSTESHPDANREKDKDYLFVIPQNFSENIGTEEHPVENQDKLYVIVEYEVTYKSGTQTSITNKVYKQITTNFLQGTAYKLNLTLGLPIEFDVNITEGVDAGVEGWGTDEEINIGSNDKNPWDGIESK